MVFKQQLFHEHEIWAQPGARPRPNPQEFFSVVSLLGAYNAHPPQTRVNPNNPNTNPTLKPTISPSASDCAF